MGMGGSFEYYRLPYTQTSTVNVTTISIIMYIQQLSAAHNPCTYWIKEEGVEDGPAIGSFIERFFTSGKRFIGYCVSEQLARLSGEHLKRRSCSHVMSTPTVNIIMI